MFHFNHSNWERFVFSFSDEMYSYTNILVIKLRSSYDLRLFKCCFGKTWLSNKFNNNHDQGKEVKKISETSVKLNMFNGQGVSWFIKAENKNN